MGSRALSQIKIEKRLIRDADFLRELLKVADGGSSFEPHVERHS
jgi:hypothetical protein